MIIPIVLAFVMTLITASSNIFLKKAFSKIGPFVAVYLSVIISTVFLWVTTFLFVPRSAFTNFPGILVFIIIGCFAPTLVRTWTYYGIERLGAGRAAPLRAMTPFFATVLAILFLKESPQPVIFLGILFILTGVVVLSVENAREVARYKLRHFLYPIGAAFLAGLAANLRKYGLNIMPQPIFAAAVAASSSAIILTFYVFLKYKKDELKKLCHKKELQLIIIAAFLTSIGEIVDLSALLYGKVSLVVPIFATTPLVIVLLSAVFLRQHETVTKKLLFATSVVALGVYLVIRSTL